jgi:hypothetical protein
MLSSRAFGERTAKPEFGFMWGPARSPVRRRMIVPNIGLGLGLFRDSGFHY